MRAIAIRQFGSADELELVSLPTPQPAEGEVLIRIVASGVNPVDWKIREGRLAGSFIHQFPLIPGWEAAGVISAVGPGVEGFSVGDRAWAYARKPIVQFGTYAEYVVLPATSVALLPEEVLLHEAGAIPLCGLTAWQSLFEGPGLASGQSVLIHAAAGGVGHLAVQLAKNAGATVLGTASADNHGFLRELGVDHVIDYKQGDFREAVRKFHPDGVDRVFDTVGGDVQAHSFDVLAKGGHIVSISSTPNAERLEQVGATGRFVFVRPEGGQLAELGHMLTGGRLRVHVSEIYSLSDAARAQSDIQGGHTRGKRVLVM